MIKWRNVEKWRDSLRTTKLGQYKNAMLDDFRDPTKACCLGICQLETQGRAGLSFKKYGVLDKDGIEFLGCKENVPKLFGIFASELNDYGVRWCDFEGLPDENIPLAGEIVEPLTFDEIADLLTIAIIEKDGIE